MAVDYLEKLTWNLPGRTNLTVKSVFLPKSEPRPSQMQVRHVI